MARTEVDLSVRPPEAPEVEVVDDAGAPIEPPDVPTPSAVNPDSVRGLLRGLTGASRHVLADVDTRRAHPDYLLFTEEELDVLVPAIVRLAERRPALARAIEKSDELTIAMTLAGYLGRNADEARDIRNERKARNDDRQGQALHVARASEPDDRRDDRIVDGLGGRGGGVHPPAGGGVV